MQRSGTLGLPSPSDSETTFLPLLGATLQWILVLARLGDGRQAALPAPGRQAYQNHWRRSWSAGSPSACSVAGR